MTTPSRRDGNNDAGGDANTSGDGGRGTQGILFSMMMVGDNAVSDMTTPSATTTPTNTGRGGRRRQGRQRRRRRSELPLVIEEGGDDGSDEQQQEGGAERRQQQGLSSASSSSLSSVVSFAEDEVQNHQHNQVSTAADSATSTTAASLSMTPTALYQNNEVVQRTVLMHQHRPPPFSYRLQSFARKEREQAKQRRRQREQPLDLRPGAYQVEPDGTNDDPNNSVGLNRHSRNRCNDTTQDGDSSLSAEQREEEPEQQQEEQQQQHILLNDNSTGYNKLLLRFGLTNLVVAMILVVVFLVVGSNDDSAGDQKKAIRSIIENSFVSTYYNISVLDDPTTPQYKALQWILHVDYADRKYIQYDYEELHISQRYALAVLYYSTTITHNGNVTDSWYDHMSFLSRKIHECEWGRSWGGSNSNSNSLLVQPQSSSFVAERFPGIICDSDTNNEVTGIYLGTSSA